MKLIVRKKSVITGKKNLEHLITYKNYPVFIGCTDQPRASDFFADMSFSICKDSGIIQLDNLIPLDILYSQYHSEAIGGLWSEHHQKFINFFSKFSPNNVLEIGGSNCFIAERYLKKNSTTKWIIIEPSLAKVKNPRIKIISKIFDGKLKLKKKINTVIHSHVLEHMYDPDKFMKNINFLINEGSLHIFSVPNLYKYMKKGYSNCINFEHSLFLTEYFIDHLLKKNGFKIIEKEYFYEHSIFYATRKTDKNFKKNLKSKYGEYKKLFIKYVNNNRKIVADINKRISKIEGDVYLFGAHVFSQMLLNLGLNEKRIKFILDNSKIKQDKRLYGTNLFVKSPDFIRRKKKAIVILRVGAYQKEVKNQIKRINKNVTFIE